MKFTLNWLKQHLDFTDKLEDILIKLTDIGLEVESIEDKSKAYAPFIVAEIIETVPHPNAEKLRICKVNIGKEILDVVCGAKNARASIKVVFAPIGSLIPATSMEIKLSEIRGVTSNGMLCSFDELALESNSEGIIELDANAVVGSSFAEHMGLNDAVIEINLTPNRGDAACVYGIARDLAAAGIGTLKAIQSINSSNDTELPIKIESEKCLQFYARRIDGVKNISNQSSMYAHMLKMIGKSPKSALVDISNFTLLNYGRPNHIYDADKIDGTIVIRMAKNGEKFVALGGEKCLLDENVLVVADDKKILAVAGVMGSELSKVDAETRNIIVEVAEFCPVAVAISGRKINIYSDSRYRFERGIDYANSEWFLNYLSNSIQSELGGEIKATGFAKTKSNEERNLPIDFNPNFIEAISGLYVEPAESIQILENLGFNFVAGKVTAPSWRTKDVTTKQDLAEEVLRIVGYHNIPNTNITISKDELSKAYEQSNIADKIKLALLARGLDQQISWSFTSQKEAEIFKNGELIELSNPINIDLAYLRPSALPNLLKIASRNAARGFPNIGLFEIGNNYGNHFTNKQELAISVVRTGDFDSKTVHSNQRKVDFYDLKADIEAALSAMGLKPENFSYKAEEIPSYLHPGKSASVRLGNKIIGVIGELHPKVLRFYQINESTAAFELYLDRLPKVKARHAKAKLELSHLQPITRDFAFIMDHNITADNLVKTVRQVEKNLIDEVKIFDVYTGQNIEPGKKSVALSIRIQPNTKSLVEAEIEKICTDIVNQVKIKFQAELRS